ncbi:MAG: WG repeat-containing protein [Aureispira sp.]
MTNPLQYFYCLLFFSVAFQTQAQLFPVRMNQQWGLVNEAGEMVVETNYEHISRLEKETYYLVQQAGKLGALDKKGKLKLPCQYENLFYLGQELFAAQSTSGWQVINETGKILFDSLDASIDLLQKGFFSYQYQNGLGLAHCNTGQLLPPVYTSLNWVRAAWVEAIDTNGGKQWINEQGQELLPRTMQEIEWSNHGLWTKRNNLWGLYDTTGQCLIPNEWTTKESCGLGTYVLTKGDKKVLYVANKQGFVKGNFTDVRLMNTRWLELHFVDGTMGLMDTTGQLLFQVEAESVASLGFGFFSYKQGNLSGIIKAKTDFKTAAKYHFIGPFSEKVALVCVDAKCGIINQQGEEVLPLIYEEGFSVRDDQARYRPEGKPMQLFNFDENGQIEGRQEFAKIRSLQIRGPRTRSNRTATTGNSLDQSIYQINDTLRWVYHTRAARWGLMNTKTKRYKYSPQWASVYVLPKQGLTIVAETKMNIGGKQDIGRINLIYNQRLGIFNNEHGLPVTPMEFLDVRLSDFLRDSLPVARCVFIGGKHGLINTRGRVIVRDYTYIGQFVDGKARATKKGKLEVDLKEQIGRYISKARAYYQAMIANYSYDQDDDLRYFQEFNRIGRLHCIKPQWGYIDIYGSVVVDFQYEHASRYHRKHAVVIKGGKQGLLNSEGLELLPPQYDGVNFLTNTDSSLYLIHKQQQWKGAVDTLGQLIFSPQYVQVRSYHEDRIAVQDTTGSWGFLDRKGGVVVPITQRRVRDYQEGRVAFLKEHRWGFYDKNGRIVVPAIYTRVGDFSEGKAWVQLPRGQRGYIDREGTLLFQGRYSRLSDFHQGLAVARVSKRGWGIIDTSGNFILKPKKHYRKITPFNEYGLAKVRVGKRYRLVDRAGKWVGKRSFGTINEFSEGLAAVRLQSSGSKSILRRNLHWRLIDTTGDFVSKEEFRRIEPFSEGLAKFKNNKGRYGYLNEKGEVVIPAVYIKADPFQEGSAVVWKTYNKTGVLDSSGQVVMPLIHDKILAYKQGLALLKKRNSGYSYIHENAQAQTPLMYRAAKPFQHQVALVKPKDKWGMINTQGLTVLSDKYDAITDFKAGAATVTINKFWGIVNDEGEILLPPIYEQIEYVGEGLFRVEKANKVGYIDAKGAWVWEMQ